MRRALPALCLLAVAGIAQAQTRPRTQAPAAKAAPARPAPPAAFDARDPKALVGLLGQVGAKAEIAQTEEDAVFLKVTTPAYGFSAQYAGCDRQGRTCKAVAFSTVSEARAPTLAQLNGFTQTSLTCRVWLDKAGKAHAMYTALVSAADSRAEMETHLGAWQGCLAEFGAFLKDPTAYLAEAP